MGCVAFLENLQKSNAPIQKYSSECTIILKHW